MTGPVINIKIDTRAESGGPRLPKGTRDPVTGKGIGGQYVSAQKRFQIRNREMADRTQATVVSNIRGRLRRPAASTNRLVTVTAAPQNTRVYTDRVQVGMPAFLDNSTAKYWRTIEEGSAAVWSRPFVGTPLSFVGGKRSSVPFPVARQQTPGIRTTAPGRRAFTYVTREIAPQNAYRDAAEIAMSGSIANIRALLEDVRQFPILPGGIGAG